MRVMMQLSLTNDSRISLRRYTQRVYGCWLLLLCLCIAQFSFALTLPAKPDNYVNDYAKVLTPAEQGQLDVTLAAFQQKTSTQIFIALFPSLDGGDVANTSIALASQWKIGQKGNDNGVLVSVFLKEHKIRIEVGYGLEGVLTDAVSGQIIRNDIAPAFQQGQYAQGLNQGVNAIMAVTQHEYKATPQKATKLSPYWTWLFILVFLLVVYAQSWLNRNTQGTHLSGNRYRGGGGSGGGFSGGGGGFSGGGGGGFGGGGASGGW